jgi:hypothetical protein
MAWLILALALNNSIISFLWGCQTHTHKKKDMHRSWVVSLSPSLTVGFVCTLNCNARKEKEHLVVVSRGKVWGAEEDREDDLITVVICDLFFLNAKSSFQASYTEESVLLTPSLYNTCARLHFLCFFFFLVNIFGETLNGNINFVLDLVKDWLRWKLS